jgi:hypothetical protein
MATIPTRSDATAGIAMFARESPLTLLVDAQTKKEGVPGDLRAMAERLAMSREGQDAKELLAKSRVRVIDPNDDPWRPRAHSLLARMHRITRQVRYRERRALFHGHSQHRAPSAGRARHAASGEYFEASPWRGWLF